MKKVAVKNYSQKLWLAAIAVGVAFMALTPSQSLAQDPALYADPHPYQSQTLIRLKTGDVPGIPGTIQTVSAIGEKFTVTNPGEKKKEYENILVIRDRANGLAKITHWGVNYAFAKGKIVSVSADNYFYNLNQQNYEPDVLGGIYFTKKTTQELVLIDSFGTVWTNTGLTAPSIRLAGGNFYISENHVLTTFKSMGFDPTGVAGMMTEKTGVTFPNAIKAGGNYFMNFDNTIVTISAINGFYSDALTLEARPAVLGGNYFIGEDHVLYTIGNEGNFYKNPNFVITKPIENAGYSYLKFKDGSFVFIDGKGLPRMNALQIPTNGRAIREITRHAGEIVSQ